MDSPESPERIFSSLARELKSIALNNVNYFQNGKHSHHAKFHVTFCLLYEYIDLGIEPCYLELCKHLASCSYDFSEQIKGNGYRSLLKVVHKCCVHLLQLCQYISTVRDSILFRKRFYAKELESYVSALGQLRGVLYYSIKLINYCNEGELFADEESLNNEVADQLVLEVETLCQEPFYGRCLGFQFCDSMYKPVQALAIAMASYSEGYLETSQMMQVASSVFNSGKYFLDPELRAQQVVKVTRTADIKFCKAFWGFSESSVMQQLPMFVCPSVEVNEVITLGPDAFKLPLVDGTDTVDITPPCAHTGPGHVYTRLISAHLREGQHALRKGSKVKSPGTAKPKAASLVIHIHGGGFVAQSSKSHEVYLREWAVTVDAPILSVDYSLAPEYPFPRALEECFYAYAWAISNCEQLGSSGDKILIVGDSAGGNLAIATAMRAASFGIRSPDSVVCVYPCTVVRYTPSPARLLSLLDPVLPVGLVVRCLAAYAGVNEEHPLSTPKMDDVHSQKSLTQIQLGTYETHDSDWLIIDKDRCPKDILKQDLLLSPESGTPSDLSAADMGDRGFRKSESMFNMGSVVNHSNEIRRQSDTEIFSQLINDGSCIFPAGTKLSNHKLPGASSCSSTLVDSSRHRDTDGPFNFGRLQHRAKLMMESAHNFFTSFASLMPSSHDVSPSFAKLRSKNSHKRPAAVISSQVSLPSQHSSSNDLFSCIPDGEENSMTEESSSLDLENSSSLSQGPPHKELASSDRFTLKACDDNSKRDSSINNSNLPAEDQLPSPASSSSLVNSSQSFATALSSPFSPSEQHIRDFIAECDEDIPETIEGAAENMILNDSLAQEIKVPSLGEVDDEKMLVHCGEDYHSKPAPVACAGPPYDDSVDPSSGENLHQEGKKGDDTHQGTKSCDMHKCVDKSKGIHSVEASGDEDQTTFLCEGGLSSGEVSPEMLADLPEESRQLLEDALECVDQMDFSLTMLEENTDSGNGILEAAPSTKTNHLDSSETLDNFISKMDIVKENIDADPLNINRLILEQIDSERSKETIGNNLLTIRDHSAGLTDSESGHCPEVKPWQSLQTGQPAVKPPSTLTLKKSFAPHSNHPSSPESPFTLGTPSSTRSESSLHQSSPTRQEFSSYPTPKILKCGSAPVLSSLSHSVSKASSLSALFSETEMPHFSKTGMSPTDFDSRIFACHSPLHKLRKAPVVKNPYMSPLLASDELLKGLSKVCIVACHLDPLLDDSISFARRLRKLSVPVELHLIDDLPHGFLNFALFSFEAKKASEFCSKKIADLLQSTGV